MRTLGHRIAIVSLFVLLVGPVARAERTITDRELDTFWQQFMEGDTSLNVYASLVSSLVMVYTDAEQNSTILQWNSGSSTFSFWLKNREISDLVTGSDEWGRPTFEGSYNAQSVPEVTGFVDVTPDGYLIIQVAEASANTMRLEVNSNGSIKGDPRECKCVGALGICTANDCDNDALCPGGDGVAVCKWGLLAIE